MLGQLSGDEFLNNLDNFFLVFISAWMGIKVDNWSDNASRLLLWIALILAYAIILATARDLVSNGNNRNFKHAVYEIFGLLLTLFLIAPYLLAVGFIDANDLIVYCHIGGLWAFLAIVPPLLSKLSKKQPIKSEEG